MLVNLKHSIFIFLLLFLSCPLDNSVSRTDLVVSLNVESSYLHLGSPGCFGALCRRLRRAIRRNRQTGNNQGNDSNLPVSDPGTNPIPEAGLINSAFSANSEEEKLNKGTQNETHDNNDLPGDKTRGSMTDSQTSRPQVRPIPGGVPTPAPVPRPRTRPIPGGVPTPAPVPRPRTRPIPGGVPTPAPVPRPRTKLGIRDYGSGSSTNKLDYDPNWAPPKPPRLHARTSVSSNSNREGEPSSVGLNISDQEGDVGSEGDEVFV